MQEHYNFSDSQMSSLAKNKVGVADLYKCLTLFSPFDNQIEPTGTICLMFYVDAKGDFNKKPFLPHKRIAQQLFKNLPTKDQIAVAQYIDDSENNFQE